MSAYENEILIKVEGLSKKFCKDLKKSLWYGIKDLFSIFSRNVREKSLRPQEFWAVKDINFELRRGECLGLIGHNGAGKSTLLKILNGLINPDEGKVTIKGKVGALIELGAGFNPILTGRENIYNNGAVLGFSRNEIDAKLEEIINFAELEEFIDMPVQNYSSGMKVRLGFAVASQMEPDVLIIDEVLAVGDLGFVLKCFKKIDALLPNTALVFVSHNMPMVSRICNRIILMDRGNAKFQGEDVSKAIDLYYKRFVNNQSNVVFSDNTVALKNVQIKTENLEPVPELKWNNDFIITLSFDVFEDIDIPKVSIIIFDKEQRPVGIFETNRKDAIKIKDEQLNFTVTHENLQLSKGIYSINIVLNNFETNAPIFRANSIISFQVLHEKDVWQPFLLSSKFN